MRTGYKVCDLMTIKPVSISPDTTIIECARLMKKHHVGSLLVRKGSRLIGLISEKAIVRKVVAKGLDFKGVTAGDIVRKRYPSIAPEKDVYDALVLMRDKNVRQLPVISGRSIVGFLTSKDILKVQPQLFELLADKIELREESRKFREF